MKIKLYWAEKFRELVKEYGDATECIVEEFLEFCDKEEKEITKRKMEDIKKSKRYKP